MLGYADENLKYARTTSGIRASGEPAHSKADEGPVGAPREAGRLHQPITRPVPRKPCVAQRVDSLAMTPCTCFRPCPVLNESMSLAGQMGRGGNVAKAHITSCDELEFYWEKHSTDDCIYYLDFVQAAKQQILRGLEAFLKAQNTFVGL